MDIFCGADSNKIKGEYSYTVTATMAQFTTCEGCTVSSTGTIYIGTPCTAPSISTGVVDNVDFDFKGKTTWNFPSCNVDPPICLEEAAYSCRYEGDINLCGCEQGDEDCDSPVTFDCETGVWEFDSDCQDCYPAGDYKVTVTMTIGEESKPCDFTFSIITHCENAVLTVM